MKSRKIRIYLDEKQRRTLKNWFGASRFAFNATVEHLRQPDTEAAWMSLKGGILAQLPDWCDDVPYQIKSVACRDACEAVKAAKRKFKATGVFQRVEFRSRKAPKQSCFIPKSAVSVAGVYHTLLGNLFRTEELPEAPLDSRLIQENGRYFLSVPQRTTVQRAENQGRIVALDPGVRTFLTYFSELSSGKLGAGAFSRVQRLCAHLDRLLSRISKANHAVKYRMRKAANRIRWKVRDLIDELHWKAIDFLTDNFDVFLLPTFETSEMSKRSKRKISKKSVRSMLTFSHFRFKERLRAKCLALGKALVDCCEAYTSKTVSWTGEIVNNLGGAKFIRSRLTGEVMDRDLNGARGILLRALADQPLLFNTGACIAESNAE